MRNHLEVVGLVLSDSFGNNGTARGVPDNSGLLNTLPGVCSKQGVAAGEGVLGGDQGVEVVVDALNADLAQTPHGREDGGGRSVGGKEGVNNIGC